MLHPATFPFQYNKTDCNLTIKFTGTDSDFDDHQNVAVYLWVIPTRANLFRITLNTRIRYTE